MKTIVKLVFVTIVSMVVAAIAGMIVLAVWNNDGAFFGTFLFVTLMIALALGAFDDPKSEELRVKSEEFASASKNYGHAAVFLGTACLFIGTPKECEELADDLQHYALQAEVSELTGNEKVFEVL